MKIRNTFIIFIVSGFWHGANWTFILWGTLNAIYFLPLLLAKKNRNNLDVVAQGKYVPNIREFFAILLTFSLTVFAWIFFRAENIGHALQYITDIFKHPESFLLYGAYGEHKKVILLIIVFLIVEWFGKEGQICNRKSP